MATVGMGSNLHLRIYHEITYFYILQTDLKELEEKFRKAMITNAQLDNEKSTLTYEVEFFKDKFTELEESHIQLNVSLLFPLIIVSKSPKLLETWN